MARVTERCVLNEAERWTAPLRGGRLLVEELLSDSGRINP